MVQARHIAAVLIAACLSGCSGYMFDQDTTASLNGSGEASSKQAAPTKTAEVGPAAEAPATRSATATPAASSEASNSPVGKPTGSLFARAAEAKPQTGPAAPVKPVAIADAGKEMPPAEPSSHAAEKPTSEPRGRAYLFRGVAGLIYSRGMDQLAERINRTGIPASVDTYLVWRGVADEAIRDYRRAPGPITIIGHSLGGDSAVAFAELLNSEKIPVSLLVTYDPTRIADDVPPNVERYINLYQSRNIMGGGDVVQSRGFHGHYASFNLKDHSEIVHINIEKAERIQQQLVTKIAELGATPATAEGEAMPLRYVVPANASIELWDSGMPVSAHAGDTLQSFAATYHVPLWALSQINRISEHAALTEGQRIVVPRHLVPMPAAVSSYAPTAR